MSGEGRVLLVDNNARNLEVLSKVLGRDGYETETVQQLDRIDPAWLEEEAFDAALVDVTRFESTVWERIALIDQQDLPMILVANPGLSRERSAASSDPESAHTLEKPLKVKNLLDLVRSMI